MQQEEGPRAQKTAGDGELRIGIGRAQIGEGTQGFKMGFEFNSRHNRKPREGFKRQSE